MGVWDHTPVGVPRWTRAAARRKGDLGTQPPALQGSGDKAKVAVGQRCALLDRECDPQFRSGRDKVQRRVVGHEAVFDPGLSGVIEGRSCREVADQELADNEGLGRDRTPLLNRLSSLKLPLLRRRNQAHLKLAERQRLEIDREIQSRIRENRVLVLSVAILCSISGIGTVGTAALLIELAGIGTLNHQLVANLAGLAPITRQLGNWGGQAFILDGRNHLHDALYMAALGATRANPDLNAISIRLRAAGKPRKLALTVLMRKLIEMTPTVVGADREWQTMPA